MSKQAKSSMTIDDVIAQTLGWRCFENSSTRNALTAP
jgi:hypothetical protein